MPRSLAPIIRAANQALIVDRDLAAIGEFFAPDYVAHLTGDEVAVGHAAIRKFLTMQRRAFPAIEVEVEILLEKKDRVAWQRTLRGTQNGAYAGFPATGRRIVWRDMFISRFEDGLFAEDWVVTELAERLLHARKR